LPPTAIAIVYHLAVNDIPLARSARGIARSFHKDRKNITRVLRDLEQLGLIFKAGDLWSLSVHQEAVADVEDVDPVGVKVTPQAAQAVGVKVTPTKGSFSPRLRGKSHPTIKEKDKKRRAGRVSSSFSLKDLGRVARSEILSGRSACVGGQVLKPGSPEFEALAQILRETPPNSGAVAS